MKTAIFIRPLTTDEQPLIQAGLRSSSAFVLRRCQILLASARREHASMIAATLGCHDQTVRNVIKDFNQRGLAILKKESCRPQRMRTSIADEALPQLRDLFHRSPHEFGLNRGLWSVPLAAKLCFAQGLVAVPITGASVRRALKWLGVSWKCAKPWITSPNPMYRQKTARDRLIDYASSHPGWAIGFLDEVWWSRFALPQLHCWQDQDDPVRLVEQPWQKNDPDPKALACYGGL